MSLHDILLIWAIIGLVMMFTNLFDAIRFYSKIKTTPKKVLFVFLLSLLGGPVTVVLIMVGFALSTLFDLIFPPIRRQWRKYVSEPLSKWFQK
jgi:uncharacterized membrane protein YgaE (UPF0421/DUF939 family)